MRFTAFYPVRRSSASGFTLLEMMVAMAITALLVAALVALGMSTGKSFYQLGNYLVLDTQSCNTADVLGKQIRNASALVAFSTNNPMYLQLTNATTGQSITITYNTNTTALTLAQTGQPTVTLLTNCYAWSFSLYDRAPNINSFSTNITFCPATNANGTLNASVCKVINMSWTCWRTMFGTKYTSESVQTAQIALRNQVTY